MHHWAQPTTVGRMGCIVHLILLLNTMVLCSADESLVFVQAIWRHGDRAPHGLPYPNDIYNETQWRRGWSQLTTLGIQQLYRLGVFFRNRYGTFIGNEFNHKEIMTMTTNSDRAIMSAEAMLRGFFPATNDSRWLEGENWQPITFYSKTPGEDDPLLRPYHFDCPTYDQLAKKDNAVVESIHGKYKEFFNFLTNVTSIPNITFDQAASLYNIRREILHNLTQPAWVYKVWDIYDNKTTLEIISEFKRISKLMKFDSDEKILLRGGILLGDWLRRLRKVVSGQQENPSKMILYSAHEDTVKALMYALKVPNNLIIPYASCLIMEIHKNNDTFTTKILFKNDTETDTLYMMTVLGCEADCPVTQLIISVEPFAIYNVSKLNKLCGTKDPCGNSATRLNTITLMSFLLINSIFFSYFNL